MSQPPFGPPFRPGTGPSIGQRDSFGVDSLPTPTFVNPSVGRAGGGTAITITGRNFRNNVNGTPPSVKINGVAATSVVVVNSFTITAVTPASPTDGLFDLTVTIGTQVGTLLNAFTYIIATILRVIPGFGPLSGGMIVMIEGVNFQLGSTVFFDDIAATNVIFIDSEHIKATTPNHAIGFVDVTVVGP